MSAAEALKLVAEVVTVRRSHPHAPAMDVLDLVMKGGRQLPEIADIAPPPSPFALVVAEAFDLGMTADEWRRWTVPPADPALMAALQGVWLAEVWPRFVQAYGAPLQAVDCIRGGRIGRHGKMISSGSSAAR